MVNSKNESLEKLDQTIRSMPQFRSHQEDRECDKNLNRETCYATAYPNTKLQEVLLGSGYRKRRKYVQKELGHVIKPSCDIWTTTTCRRVSEEDP